MRFSCFFIFALALHADFSYAEGGCPAGQYPIGGQGAIACAPMPQGEVAPARPRPIGKWIKTWGAIAMGSINSVINYGVSSGKLSKSAAKEEALTQCSSHGETNCEVRLTYENQCAAISTPEINGKPSGTIHFSGSATIDAASADASSQCRKNNPPPAQCRIIYSNCTEQVFQNF
ncbi:DUF4189 domain-containing protein [Xanthomonas hortorum]|uniref:DUF4189 domain-containing protein n=2 Tax=Xanthomonas hortorum TaxID=56454 RepID=A0AAW9ZXQ9_9XANT|nr:DUF4189 domain-containing protein [Xanthomonas hortorum]NMI24566.1 DUF4189 domain-containing protein [Xanthomonas hortorum pv. pelargonii]